MKFICLTNAFGANPIYLTICDSIALIRMWDSQTNGYYTEIHHSSKQKSWSVKEKPEEIIKLIQDAK